LGARGFFAGSNPATRTKSMECQFCQRLMTLSNLKKHENSCIKNPKYIKECPNCGNNFFSRHKKTCSYGCANSFFRKGIIKFHDPEKLRYSTICFRYHEKICAICAESNIVTVHHLDGDHKNDNPMNLIPLCPTHHFYCHSNYRHLVEPKIKEWIENYHLSVIKTLGLK
jgi:hypothetical protein